MKSSLPLVWLWTKLVAIVKRLLQASKVKNILHDMWKVISISMCMSCPSRPLSLVWWFNYVPTSSDIYTWTWFISYHIISYHIISYHIISCHVMSCHVMSYHTISYHTEFALWPGGQEKSLQRCWVQWTRSVLQWSDFLKPSLKLCLCCVCQSCQASLRLDCN